MKLENLKEIKELAEELRTRLDEHTDLLDDEMVENEEEIEKIADEINSFLSLK